MKKVLLVPDSFKGTMSSQEICDIVSARVLRYYPGAKVVPIPVADGGEGSVDCFLAAMAGEKIFLTVSGPYGDPVEAFYGVVDGGKTAIVEMAACAGLPLVAGNPNPAQTTTFGVGQLIAHAAQQGCEKIIVGLGGSATNDFGAGMAAALGVRFLDAQGQSFVPVGGTLSRVHTIDITQMLPALQQVTILTMCDIDNPLYGKNGAAYVFAPQKGADAQMVQLLDAELRALSNTVFSQLGVDVSQLPGAGAAGGMGGGMVAFLGSQLQMGIETVLDTVAFDQLVAGADLVISGEGKIDSQSLRGKVVVGVARRCKQAGVPLVAIVGDIGDEIEGIYDEGVSGIFSINRVAVPFAQAKERSRQDLALTADNLMGFLSRMGL